MGISDNHAIFLYKQVNTKLIENKLTKYKRLFNDENIEYLKFMLQKENWNVLELNETNVDGKSLELIKTLTHHFNTAFPIKKFKISPKNNRSGYWITKGIINSSKRKRELYKLCQITNDTELKTLI
jgi:hypothetical protein